jgi:uncharacterized protein with HEPN domain
MQRSDSQRVSDMLTYLADRRTMKAVAYSLQVMGEWDAPISGTSRRVSVSG